MATPIPQARALLALPFLLLPFIPAAAQEPDPAPPPEAREAEAGPQAETVQEAPEQALRVFLDCTAGFFCDFDYFRREIPFVNYVRDRQAAQVHVLITRQGTGGGGQSFTLDFLGREEFQGMEDRLRLTTRANLAQEQVLEQLTRRIAMGLVRFMARTADAERLDIGFIERVGEQAPAARPEDDPWNFWVFETSLRGSFDKEERVDGTSAFGSLSANRVTEGLKIELDTDGSYRENKFAVNDTTTVTSIRRSYEAEGLVVWSLGPRWSAGAVTSVEHSTFQNREVALRVAPALEYNLFRYDESQRKQLTFQYGIGLNSFNWIEETIFGETSEARLDQRLRVSLNVNQPWGRAGGRLTVSNLLDDFAQNRVQLFAGSGIRLFQGLSLDLSGNISRVRDQINLPLGDASEEEVLLRIRELQTGFRYGISVGFSYTFGSIFSNVVNPRF